MAMGNTLSAQAAPSPVHTLLERVVALENRLSNLEDKLNTFFNEHESAMSTVGQRISTLEGQVL